MDERHESRGERTPSAEEGEGVSADDLAEMTPEERAEAKEYGRRGLRLALCDMGLDFAFLLVFVLFLARPLDEWLARFAWLGGDAILPRTARLGVFIVLYMLLHAAISIGLSFYRGYVVEHQFGLSNQTVARWVTQYGKGIALAMIANLIVFVGLYWIMWLLGDWWWLAAAGAAFAFAVLIGYIAPVLILPLFLKYEPLNDEKLQEELSKLAEGTGLTIEGTYRLLLSADTKKANAMLAGLGRTRRVLLGDTLLENFSTDEIKVVMAHEIGHHVFGHTYKLLLLSLPYMVAVLFLCHLIMAAWLGEAYDPRTFPVYAAAILMLLFFVIGAVSGPLQHGLMRHFERQCDRYALARTALADAYRSAFTKLARLNKADPDPHWLEVVLFDDHPPIAERLAMAEETWAQQGAGGDKVRR